MRPNNFVFYEAIGLNYESQTLPKVWLSFQGGEEEKNCLLSAYCYDTLIGAILLDAWPMIGLRKGYAAGFFLY